MKTNKQKNRNKIRGNKTRGNKIRGNKTRGNKTRGNKTRGNKTRGNKIRRNKTHKSRKKTQRGGDPLDIKINAFNEKISNIKCIIKPVDLAVISTILIKYKKETDNILQEYLDGKLLTDWEKNGLLLNESYLRDEELFREQEEQLLVRPSWQYIYAVNKFRERFPDDINVRQEADYKTILKKIMNPYWGKTKSGNELPNEYMSSTKPWENKCRQFDSKITSSNTAQCQTADIYLKRNMSNKKDLLSCSANLFNTHPNAPNTGRFLCSPRDDMYGLIPKPYITLFNTLINKKIGIFLFPTEIEEQSRDTPTHNLHIDSSNLIIILNSFTGDTETEVTRKKIGFLLYINDRVNTLERNIGQINWYMNFYRSDGERESSSNKIEILDELGKFITELLTKENSIIELQNKPLSFILIPDGTIFPEAVLRYIKKIASQLLTIILYNVFLIISDDEERSREESSKFINEFMAIGTSMFVGKHVLGKNSPLNILFDKWSMWILRFVYNSSKLVGYSQHLKNDILKQKFKQCSVDNSLGNTMGFLRILNWVLCVSTMLINELSGLGGDKLNDKSRINLISFLKYISKLAQQLDIPGGSMFYNFFSSIQKGYTGFTLNGNIKKYPSRNDIIGTMEKMDLGL